MCVSTWAARWQATTLSVSAYLCCELLACQICVAGVMSAVFLLPAMLLLQVIPCLRDPCQCSC